MNKYNWAINDIKLALAKKDLEFKKQLDPKFEINEESIKAQYIKRGGLVVDEDTVVINETAPTTEAKTVVESRKVSGGSTAKRIIRRK